MNRAQRRAAAKHARRAKPARTLYQRTLQKVTDSLASLQLLDDARPFDAGDTTDQHIKTRFAFGRLCDGTAGDDDFDRVAIAINLAKVRALDIDLQLADLLEVAQNAMTALRKRQERWGKWDVLPAERGAVQYALDANEAIVDASSPLQMRIAMGVVRRSIQKNQGTKHD